MKIKQLLYPIAIASIVFSSSCDRSEASYIQPKCQFPSKQEINIYSANETDKYWGFYSLQEWVSAVIRYSDKPFTDLCTNEKNGVNVRVRGNFINVKAYMKMTNLDSVEVPLKKTVVDSTKKLYSFDGELDTINLAPYYKNYPGQMKPVLYITMPFDNNDKNNYPYLIERLKINLLSIEIRPTGSKTL